MNNSIQEENVKIIKNMLFWLHQICLKHNLRYLAKGGTLIGAVRHQGVIPWDGDADVFMPIDDWLKLHELVTEIEDPYFLNPDGSWTSERTPISGALSSNHPQKGVVKKFNIPNDLFFQSSATDSHMAGRIIKIRSKEFYNIPAGRGPSYAGVQLDIFPTTIQHDHILIDYEETPTGDYHWQPLSDVFPLVALPFEDREIFCAKNHLSRLKDAYGAETPPFPKNRRAHEGPVAKIKSRPLDFYLQHFRHLHNEDMSLKDATICGSPETVEQFLLKNNLQAENPDSYIPKNTTPRRGVDPFWKLFSRHLRTKGKEFVSEPPPEL